jgi:hypothetical protein
MLCLGVHRAQSMAETTINLIDALRGQQEQLKRLLIQGDLNRSTQHLLILLDKEVADGDVTDIVHGEAKG